MLFLPSGTLPPTCPQGNRLTPSLVQTSPSHGGFPDCLIENDNLPTTLIPFSISLSPSNAVLLRLLAYGLGALLEHKLHEGRGFALSAAGSRELRSVPSTWPKLK